MEEILASIRKIISEDDENEEASEASASEDGETKDGETKDGETKDDETKDGDGAEDDVLELTERVEEEEDSVAETSMETEAEDQIDAILAESDADAEPGAAAGKKKEGLVSDKTKSGVSSAMAQFAGALAKEKGHSGPVVGGGPTLDALVLAALEPVLKTWLDENLEPLVERLVKEELKRLARRAEDEL
jgi:cell pole-organizing protein PopZ